MDVLLVCFFVLLIGACIGSFLNVVALRALSKESIVFPSSKCPECNEPIKWYDNIPVFSYLFTFRGKCRNCGCHVSKMYPIVEAITSILFLLTVLAFGFSLQTLVLLVLLCVAMVIMITDFKKEYVFDVHMWFFIVMAVVYSILFNKQPNQVMNVGLGLLVGAVTMEVLARLSYFLVRKKSNEEETSSEENKQEEGAVQEVAPVSENEEQNEVEKTEDEEDIDINEYVKKNKRAFGEGDTYLAAGVGALLGWQGFLVALPLAIIVQAVCILPQFFISLYKQKEFRLLFSLIGFVLLAVLYWILSNIVTLNVYLVFAILMALIFFAIDSIQRLKRTVNEQGFVAIPFGPAILISGFLMLFFGKYIVSFLIKYIFMLV